MRARGRPWPPGASESWDAVPAGFGARSGQPKSCGRSGKVGRCLAFRARRGGHGSLHGRWPLTRLTGLWTACARPGASRHALRAYARTQPDHESLGEPAAGSPQAAWRTLGGFPTRGHRRATTTGSHTSTVLFHMFVRLGLRPRLAGGGGDVRRKRGMPASTHARMSSRGGLLPAASAAGGGVPLGRVREMFASTHARMSSRSGLQPRPACGEGPLRGVTVRHRTVAKRPVDLGRTIPSSGRLGSHLERTGSGGYATAYLLGGE